MPYQDGSSQFQRDRLPTGRPVERYVPNPGLPLREQVREVMRFLHYSPRTEETYWQWTLRFLQFHRRPGQEWAGVVAPPAGAGSAGGPRVPDLLLGHLVGVRGRYEGDLTAGYAGIFVATTQIYAHVTTRAGIGVRSPLDDGVNLKDETLPYRADTANPPPARRRPPPEELPYRLLPDEPVMADP